MVQWPYMQSAAQGVIAFALQLRYTRVIFSSIFFKDSLYKVTALYKEETRVRAEELEFCSAFSDIFANAPLEAELVKTKTQKKEVSPSDKKSVGKGVWTRAAWLLIVCGGMCAMCGM